MALVMKHQPHMNRAEVIFKWTALMQHETRCSEETFAIRAVSWYLTNVPEEARSLIFQSKGDTVRCAKSNAQRLFRYPNPDVNARFPVELEEAWVLGGLIEPYRSECVRELAHRYGLLAVRLPEPDGKVAIQSLGTLTSEMGHALQILGPIYADGQIDQDERRHLPQARAELEKLIATAEELLAQINHADAAPHN